MKIDECKVGMLVMSQMPERDTYAGNYQRIKMRYVYEIIGFSMNCTNEVILKTNRLEYNFLNCGPECKSIDIHPGNVEPYDSETYFKDVIK
jgi:hypothetical protein